ncbi:MAG: hypothetical protein JWP91_2386 [Fibrobacteres bacterium]|nr:hypothetical protein [Fibrobacterota bacterium]
MIHLILYQLFPLAAAWFLFAALEKWEGPRRFCIPALFIAGGLLQFWLWGKSDPNLDNPDSLGFFRLGHGLESDLRSILFRPKLYPLFLGMFPSLKAATFAQCMLKLGMGILLFRLSRVLAWKERTGRLAIFLFLFNSLWLQEPLRIMDTTLFAFLFTAFLSLAAEIMAGFSVPKFTALCLAAGLATLTRQVGDVSLALCGALVLLSTRKAWLPRYRAVLAAMILGLAVGFSGALRNGMAHGVYRRTVSLGVSLYTHLSYYELADPASPEWDFVSRFLPGERERIGPWDPGFALDIPWPVNALPHRLERAMGSGSAAEIEAADREFARRFSRWAWGNPRRYLRSVGNEGARLLWKCEEEYPESILAGFPGMPDLPPAVLRIERGLIHQPPWILLVLSLLSIAVDRKRRKIPVLLAAGACAYLALFALIQLGFTRYALPALPCLLVLACHASDLLPGLGTWRKAAPDASRIPTQA